MQARIPCLFFKKNMATSQALLKWNDGRFINLIKYLQEFESSMEF